MPAWLFHSQNFRAFLRRWGIGSQQLTELYTGVLPVSQVQRNYQDDEIDTWGCTGSVTIPAGGNRTGTVGLVAGSSAAQTLGLPAARALFVRCIEVYAVTSQGFAQDVTPFISLYQPTGVYAQPPDPPPNIGQGAGTVGGKLGGFTFHGGAAPAFVLPGAYFSRGFAQPTGLVSVGLCDQVVPLIPFTPAQHFLKVLRNQYGGEMALGWTTANAPQVSVNSDALFSFNSSAHPVPTRILDWPDPPIRVLPDQVLAVQNGALNASGSTIAYFVTFYWQEVDTEAL